MQRENNTTFIYKIIFNTESIESFEKIINETGLEDTETSKTPAEANWNKPCKNN